MMSTGSIIMNTSAGDICMWIIQNTSLHFLKINPNGNSCHLLDVNGGASETTVDDAYIFNIYARTILNRIFALV